MSDNLAQETPAAYLVLVRKGPSWHPGDLEPLCLLLSKRFAGELWAFGSYDADMMIGRIRLRAVKERSSVHVWNLARFGRHVLRWADELRAAHKPGLVVICFEPFKGGLLALYTARRAKGALICEVNGVYASPSNVADTRFAWMRAMRQYLRRLVGAFVVRRATAVRLLFADQLRGFARLPANVVIRQFFDKSNTERFYPGAEEPLVLAVGFPFRVKGFDILCEAFRRVALRHPAWKLVLIGHRVPEELRAGGFEHPQIAAYPGVLQTDVAQWMSRCAIFALPSRTEAMGRVLIEAGAAGKCRLATRVDGIPTVVEDGVDGMLIEKENVVELSAALETLMQDAALRSRLGQAARRRVAQEFSPEAYLQHYAELVDCALGRGER
jgi:glycosyltransferase involved in cell wall biosynthesis